MSPQLQHALLRALLMIILAALGIAGSEAAGIITALGADPLLYGGIVAAVIAAATRAVEGHLDANRAAEGLVQKSDVGFQTVAELAIDPVVPDVFFVNREKTVVQVPPPA
jgi:hypothetical protein